MSIPRSHLVAFVLSTVLTGELAAQSFTLHADQVYATVPTAQGSKDLVLDLYLPTGVPTPMPLVVWIHGGGWSGGTEDNPGGLFLLNSGFALASVEYRLSGQAKWPAQIQDVKGAVRWLRANAATFGLDAERFGAFGSSAGGHLAAFLGTSADQGMVELGGVTFDLEGTTGGNLGFSSRVQAVSDFYGPTDFLWMDVFPSNIDHDSANSPESNLIGADIDELPMAVASADPATWLSRDDPPLHLQHGTADPAVPFAQSERFYREARLGCGLDVEFFPVPDGGHGGPGFDHAKVAAFFTSRIGSVPSTMASIAALVSSIGEDALPTMAFRISRTGVLTHPLVVRIAVSGKAEEGLDLAPLGTFVLIPSGSAAVDLPLTLFDDTRVEGTESLEIAIAASLEYGVLPSGARAVVSITDDDAGAGLPVVSIVATDSTASEGGSDPSSFTLTRTGATATPLSVTLRRSGRALEFTDYLGLGPVVTIPAGAPSHTVALTPVNDSISETLETVVLEIEPASHYAVGASHAAYARILDDDSGTLPLVCVTVEDDVLAESDPLSNAFLVTRTGSTSAPQQVFFQLLGEASIGADFAPTGATLTFAIGENSRRVRVDPIDDAAIEGDESLVLNLLPGSGYRVGPQRAVALRIVDSDSMIPSVSPARLEVSPIERGNRFVMRLLGIVPGTPYVVFAGAAAGFVPANPYPLTIDAATFVPLFSGFLDANAIATLAVPVPSAGLDDLVAPFYFQAATIDGTPVPRFSNREDRLFRPAR